MRGGVSQDRNPGRYARMTLSKHHGQGNDFLVWIDLESGIASHAGAVSPDQVMALCDRRRGLGADGFIRAYRPPDDGLVSKPYELVAAMELFNADGSVAEMSGNGIRCLGQALWNAGIAKGDEALIATDAGVRKLTLGGFPAPGIAMVSVSMGEMAIGEDIDPQSLGWMHEDDQRGVGRAATVDAGNPHLVLLVEGLEDVDLDRIGKAAASAYPAGVNVEVVAPDGEAGTGGVPAVDMVVFERGVGRTLACGTGSCAVAAAVRQWGLVGDDMVVANPGGPLYVTFGEGEAVLSGEVVHVADVVVDSLR